MKGQVYVEYRRLGLYAVKIEDQTLSVIQVRNGTTSLIDQLVGGLDSFGEKQLYNETTKDKLDVSVLSIQLTLAEAKSYIKDTVRGK